MGGCLRKAAKLTKVRAGSERSLSRKGAKASTETPNKKAKTAAVAAAIDTPPLEDKMSQVPTAKARSLQSEKKPEEAGERSRRKPQLTAERSPLEERLSGRPRSRSELSLASAQTDCSGSSGGRRQSWSRLDESTLSAAFSLSGQTPSLADHSSQPWSPRQQSSHQQSSRRAPVAQSGG